MKLEVGKYYKNRKGYVVGPVQSNNDCEYPFQTVMHGVYRSYTSNGRYYVADEDDIDLVEEVNADGSPIEANRCLQVEIGDSIQRLEVAYGVLTAMIASPPVCNRDEVDKAKWCGIAFEWADEFIKVAKQS